MEATDGYQLTFDRVDKSYRTENRKFIIWPPLSKALKKEELSGTEIATTDFVLRTGNATMYVHFYIAMVPFHFLWLSQKVDLCRRDARR